MHTATSARNRVFSALLQGMGLVVLLLLAQTPEGKTQAEVTASGLNTAVVHNGTVYEITGGARPGNGSGPNLFHSFGDFSLAGTEVARFQTSPVHPIPDPTVSNILGRVTGGNPSSIFGSIDSSTYFPNANLFLLNPAGFLFGPNATVDVGGMVAFTTADYLRLADNMLFNAVPNTAADALLSTASVAAYGFLGSSPGAITVQGSQFTVTESTGVSLVGGNITIESGALDNATVQPARLSAPNGQINLASIGSPGELLTANLFPVANVNDDVPAAAGHVQLAAGSTVDVTGSGSVSIRGGQFVIDVTHAMLTTATPRPTGKPDNLLFSPGSSLDTQTFGVESGSDIQVVAAHVTMDDARIQSQTFGVGTGGGISIDTQTLNIMNDSLIESRAEGPGLGGAINITSLSVDINAAHIFSSVTANDFVAGQTFGPPITLNVDNLNIRGGGFISTESIDNFFALQPLVAGTITINANNNVRVSGTSPDGQFSKIESRSDTTAVVGNIVIHAATLSVTREARINSDASFGQAGQILITATDSVNVTEGAKIRMDTGFTGGGLIDISARSIDINQAIIQTRSVGEGDAGAVHLHGDNITLAGGQINSQTDEGLGRGGDVILNATQNVSIMGQFAGNSIDPAGPAGIFTTTAVQGAPGGNVTIMAGQSMIMTNGASVSASSTGLGSAGNIAFDAGNQFLMTNSTVTTEATQSGGGTIKITTDPTGTVQLTNSTISASVLDGTGGGGSVNIDPQFVILINSQILATAIQGAGGNIFITTNLLLPDANSLISASSQFGQNGTITIQSPNAPISGQIHPLGKTPLLATSLLNQQCASVAGGQFSSFTIAGRDSLPTEPGSWLTSPLYTAGVGQGITTEGRKDEGERPDRQMVSLRQITPAGFLTRSFAVERSVGCQS